MEIQVDWEIYNTRDQQELLRQLAHNLYHASIIADVSRFVAEVNKREEIASTVVADNLAIPHVHSSNILIPLIKVVKLPSPLNDWSGQQGIDRLVLAMLPRKISADDRQKFKQFFSNLGRQPILNLFSSGSQREIKQYLREKRGDSNNGSNRR